MGGATNILYLTGIRHTHTYMKIPNQPQRSNHAPKEAASQPPTVTHRTQVGYPTHVPKATQATTQSGHKTTHREKPLYISRGGAAAAYRPSRSAQARPPHIAVVDGSGVVRLVSGRETPSLTPIRCGKYRAAGVAYCVVLVFPGGCVGTAKTPPRWAGSVGRFGRRGFVGFSWCGVLLSWLRRGFVRCVSRWCR